MPVERSAGIIFFRNTPEGRKYLVLRSSRKDQNRPEFWDFTKGILYKGEHGIDAARREAQEEVGANEFTVIEEFKTTVNYFTRHTGKPVPKFVAMFLAELKNSNIKLSWEHDKYEWLSYEEAHKRLSVPQMKEALEAAEKFLRAQEQSK